MKKYIVIKDGGSTLCWVKSKKQMYLDNSGYGFRPVLGTLMMHLKFRPHAKSFVQTDKLPKGLILDEEAERRRKFGVRA